VDALAQKLDARLRAWKPGTAAELRERITAVIELADHDVLRVALSRAAEQEVLCSGSLQHVLHQEMNPLLSPLARTLKDEPILLRLGNSITLDFLWGCPQALIVGMRFTDHWPSSALFDYIPAVFWKFFRTVPASGINNYTRPRRGRWGKLLGIA